MQPDKTQNDALTSDDQLPHSATPTPEDNQSSGVHTPPRERNEQPESQSPALKPTTQKPRILVGLAVIAVVGVVSFLVIGKMLKPPSPDEAFRQAITNALSTKSLTTTGTDIQSDDPSKPTITTVKYDTRNVKDIKISTERKSDQSDELSYGTRQNVYFKYHYGDNSEDFMVADKWVQLKKDGAYPAQDGPWMDENIYIDPVYVALGQFIVGNFTETDRNALLNAASKSHVYTYDSAKVRSTTYDGEKVYAYDLVTDLEALRNYKLTAAKFMGIDPALARRVVADTLSSPVTLYISQKSPRIVATESSGTGQTNKTVYTKWSETTLPAEPKADMQISDYIKKVDAYMASHPKNNTPAY